MIDVLLHVIDDKKSTDNIFVMQCGASCFVALDGTTIPYLNFFGEKAAHKATCAPCRGTKKSDEVKREKAEVT